MTIEDLKCCGNCKHYEEGYDGNECRNISSCIRQPYHYNDRLEYPAKDKWEFQTDTNLIEGGRFYQGYHWTN